MLVRFLLFALLSNAAWANDDQRVDYARDIAPLLLRRCADCHGPEAAESGLRVDLPGRLLRGGDSGEVAISPGAPDKSFLLQVVSGQADLVMPPDGPRLTEAELDMLRRWIEQGASVPIDALDAQQEQHWAFLPVSRSPQLNWGSAFADIQASSPIDAWIGRTLSENDLRMNPPADRRALIRRLFLVMLGLPPTLEQIERFVNDQDPLAWERLVDQTLASPRYGERWARHWLDLVRFGETDGFETNRERPHAWRYRDWVIGAFNEDMPYDEFIRQQLAGDVCGEPVGTSFLVAGAHDIVKSPDINLTLMQREDELADLVNAVGTTFLGLTLGCARCHNHKFDPITQVDYYSIQAVFAGVEHGDRQLPTSGEQVDHAYAGQFKQPEPTHRLYRGDPLARREQVAPDAVAALGHSLKLPLDAPESMRRMALADWIARPDHPLTARVMANRLWQFHFGAGLVDTPSDFGSNGVPPSHPELLDWLAAELTDHQWSLKRVHRLILLSRAWRQSSVPRPEALQVDAGSRLLWRFPPRRLEAEAIRDAILAASGVLDQRMGGPGFSAFEIEMENVRHYFPKSDYGPADWRRMIYMTKVRQEKDSVFGVFDCPDASQVAPKRSRSTTPLQALNLLNSRFVLQQAERMAERLRCEAAGEVAHQEVAHQEVARQVAMAFELCFGRPASQLELQQSVAFVGEHGLLAFCRALFNSNEFLFVP